MPANRRSLAALGRSLCRPLPLSLALYLLVSSIAAASLRQSVTRAAPPLAREQATGTCPAADKAGGVRVVAAGEQAGGASQMPAPGPAEAPTTPPENPEGKNSPGCVHCHHGVESSH